MAGLSNREQASQELPLYRVLRLKGSYFTGTCLCGFVLRQRAAQVGPEEHARTTDEQAQAEQGKHATAEEPHAPGALS